MEKALHLTPPQLGPRALKAAKGFDALYLGDEFCLNLLPEPDEFARARRAFGGRTVLTTPLLTDAALDSVLRIVDANASAREPLELVVNDLGLLCELRRRRRAGRVRAALGRVFGHRVKVMARTFAERFLKEQGLARIELDDPALLARFASFGLPLSFHAGFRYVSVTRFCPWERHWPAPCAYACVGRSRVLEHAKLPQPLVLRGSAYGVSTAAAPKHPLVDRVVTEPRVRALG
ncbi:MAG: hypothetical protein WC969_13355 [Elusimicrobiota bacterium]|jgi:hypothetical protein